MNSSPTKNSVIHRDLNIREYKLINFVNLSDNEVEMVRKWRNEEKVRKWMFNDELISIEEHIKFIGSLKETKNKIYWLVKNNEYYIGVLYFVNIMWNHRNAYFGMYANPKRISQGSGKILLSLLLEVAFNFLKLHSLKLEVVEDNKVAINLYRKFGFEEEGKLKEFVYRNGEWKDVIIMGMINPKEKKGNENKGQRDF